MYRVQRLRARGRGGTSLPLCVKLKGTVACGKPLEVSVSNGFPESRVATESHDPNRASYSSADLCSSESSPEHPQPNSSLAPSTGRAMLLQSISRISLFYRLSLPSGILLKATVWSFDMQKPLQIPQNNTVGTDESLMVG